MKEMKEKKMTNETGDLPEETVIWIATENPHKREEFAQMLEGRAVVRSLQDLSEPVEIEETGTTFEENALIKARSLHKVLHESVIADDSGLEVDALNKEPGIYSARYMGKDTSYDVKNQAIIDRLDAMGLKGSERSARFVCAVAWIEKDGTEHVFRGTMEGWIHDRIEGSHGFGYDPIFYFPPFQTTSANVEGEKKNEYSHRHNALAQFLQALDASKTKNKASQPETAQNGQKSAAEGQKQA